MWLMILLLQFIMLKLFLWNAHVCELIYVYLELYQTHSYNKSSSKYQIYGRFYGKQELIMARIRQLK